MNNTTYYWHYSPVAVTVSCPDASVSLSAVGSLANITRDDNNRASKGLEQHAYTHSPKRRSKVWTTKMPSEPRWLLLLSHNQNKDNATRESLSQLK